MSGLEKTKQLHKWSVDNLIGNFVEVSVGSSDDFLKIRETLTRIGIANRESKTLYQSCHILHKKGKYYIVHFKELIALDVIEGKEKYGSDERTVEFTAQDECRRNSIAKILEKYNLLSIKTQFTEEYDSTVSVTVLPYSDKHEWSLKKKYFMRVPNK